MSSSANLLWLGVVSLSLGACQTPGDSPGPGPLASMHLRAGVHYSSGSPLVADVRAPGVAPASAEAALEVRVAVLSLSAEPLLPGLLPLSAHTRFVLRSHDEAPISAQAQLLGGARWALRPAPQGVASICSVLLAVTAGSPLVLEGVLPLGVTASFRVYAGEAEGNLSPEGGRVLLYRIGERLLEVGLEVERNTVLSQTGVNGLPEHELALLEPTDLLPGHALLLVVPSPFADPGSWGFAVVVSTSAPPRPGSPGALAHLERFRACVAELGSATPLQLAPPPAMASLDGVELDQSAPLGHTGGRRSPLVALASASEAPLSLDLARSASEELLDRIARRVLATHGAPLAPSPELGVALECASLAALAEESELTPERFAVLLRYAGGLALDRRRLGQAARGAETPAAIADSLVANNRLLLEDSDPEVRAHADTWLRRRGLGVAGYDPLAGGRERRQALRPFGGRPR